MTSIIDVVVESNYSGLRIKHEGFFLQIMSDLCAAIRTFNDQCASQHLVNIFDCKVDREITIEVGSYYMSGILRLNFAYQKANQEFRSSVILKVPQLGPFHEYGTWMMYYNKEKFIYERVIPLMYQNWAGEKVVPDFFACTDSGILILENLHESGFHGVEKGSFMDFSKCKTVLKALAQFHALSIEHVDDLSNDLDSRTSSNAGSGEWANMILSRIMSKLKQYVLCSWPKYAQKKFDDYVRDLKHHIELGFRPNEGGFNVILHGDLHIHNILFNGDHQNNEISQCKLIDFQNSRRGSPIIDIMAFFVTGVEFNLFQENCEYLFDYYLNELENVLKQIDPTKPCPYGLHELLADFEKYKLYLHYFFMACIPIYWADPMDLHAGRNEHHIDEVMKSEKYISLFNGWTNFILSDP